jgi:hypothetical protein
MSDKFPVYLCPFHKDGCLFRTEEKKHFDTHMKSHETSYACGFCKKFCKTIGLLMQHYESHTDILSSYRHDSKRKPEEQLQSHIRTQLRTQPKPNPQFAEYKEKQHAKVIKCKIDGCGKIMKDHKSLVIHWTSSVHGVDAIEAFNKAYTSPYLEMIKPDSDEEWTKCNKCAYQAREAKSVKNHVEKYHSSSQSDSKYDDEDEDDDEESEEYEYLDEEDIVMTNNDKDVAFSKNDKIATKDMQLSCTLCSKKYNDANHLMRHLTAEHVSNPIDAFTIVYTGENFQKIKKNADDGTWYKCNHCAYKAQYSHNVRIIHNRKYHSVPMISTDKEKDVENILVDLSNSDRDEDDVQNEHKSKTKDSSDLAKKVHLALAKMNTNSPQKEMTPFSSSSSTSSLSSVSSTSSPSNGGTPISLEPDVGNSEKVDNNIINHSVSTNSI